MTNISYTHIILSKKSEDYWDTWTYSLFASSLQSTISCNLLFLAFQLGMFSVNRLTKKISVNRFSINRTENGGQDGVMQNAHRGSPVS